MYKNFIEHLTIGLDTEDKITEFIDYIDDLKIPKKLKVMFMDSLRKSHRTMRIIYQDAYVVMTNIKANISFGNFEDQCCIDFAISYPPL